ncbi:MAG TPA: DUF4269 domain-containing protein [Chryseosolibacter sp.]
MLPDFENIAYLKSGSPIQLQAFNILTHSKILYHLQPFRPVLTGTLPLDLFVPGKSDLDIIIESDRLQIMERRLLDEFSNKKKLTTKLMMIQKRPTLVCRFIQQDFPIEIFCQPVPVKQQLAYRHMVIEHWLLQKSGPAFRQRVLQLKQGGMKTEPAFAAALNLEGDPYQALLKFEQDEAFRKFIL